MADEDNTNVPDDLVKTQLDTMSQQLADMNQQYQASQTQYQQDMQGIVDSITAQNAPVVDEFATEEEKRINSLEAQIQEMKNSAPQQTQDLLRKERQLNDTVFKLSQDFPEISSDAAIQQKIIKEHNSLTGALKDTSEGYELAVQRVTAREGLVPKARRKGSMDEDISKGASSGGGGGAAGAAKKKTKIDDKTLQMAQLLGRDIEDPKVLEGLEKATNRDTYGRWS